MLGVLAIVFVGRVNQAPRWWVASLTSDPARADVYERAEQFENAISTQLTAVRDAENPRWAVAITPEQANAWLSARLQRTIETHLGAQAWPAEIGLSRVMIDDDQLIVGVQLLHTSGSTVVWGHVKIEVDQTGDLFAHLSSIHLGDAWVPTRLISQPRVQIGSGQLELGDGRIVEMLGMRVQSGRLELAMQTRVID